MADQYDISGLLHGIERSKHNIQVLKEAIKKEEKTVADYRIMIDSLERDKKRKEAAEEMKNVEIIRE